MVAYSAVSRAAQATLSSKIMRGASKLSTHTAPLVVKEPVQVPVCPVIGAFFPVVGVDKGLCLSPSWANSAVDTSLNADSRTG